VKFVVVICLTAILIASMKYGEPLLEKKLEIQALQYLIILKSGLPIAPKSGRYNL